VWRIYHCEWCRARGVVIVVACVCRISVTGANTPGTLNTSQHDSIVHPLLLSHFYMRISLLCFIATVGCTYMYCSSSWLNMFHTLESNPNPTKISKLSLLVPSEMIYQPCKTISWLPAPQIASTCNKNLKKPENVAHHKFCQINLLGVILILSLYF
jgi:hypothetical protein